MAFDCLYARGKDLRKRALRVRRNVLEEIIDRHQPSPFARPARWRTILRLVRRVANSTV
jgi:ATP-dependent DNA ligase